MATYTVEDMIAAIGQLVGDDKNVIRECEFIPFLYAKYLLPTIGLAMCRNFNIAPEDLRWKLEAANFSSTATHSEISSVTLDTIITLKAQMQRELTQKRAVPKSTTVPANTSRLRRNIVMPGMNSAHVASISGGRDVAKQIKQEDIRTPGPSRVVFSEQDDKQQRVCESWKLILL